MVYKITCQTKAEAADPYSRFTTSIFVESNTPPNIAAVTKALKATIGDDFDPSTICIDEWQEWDADKMRKAGLPVQRI